MRSIFVVCTLMVCMGCESTPPESTVGGTTATASDPTAGSTTDPTNVPVTVTTWPKTLPPKPIPAQAATLSMASTWDDLTAGRVATTFDHSTTTDVLVRANLDPKYKGHPVALNLISPNGTKMAGYKDTVADDGTASFDVKLLGTFVGRNALTGNFQLDLGDAVTQTGIVTRTLTLTNGGVQ